VPGIKRRRHGVVADVGFVHASAVQEQAPGRYAGEIRDGWSIAGNANGGYLLAIAARAMRDASGRDDPISVTAHYLRPGKPGPVTVSTATLKEGRTFTVVQATLESDGAGLLALLGTFGRLAPSRDSGGHELVDAAAPDLPPLDECVRMPATDGFPPPFMAQVDLRLHPEDAGFLDGIRSGSARMRGWFAFPGGEPVDTIGLLQAADAFPPTIFNAELPVAWTPTVELTAHVRARPAVGWMRCSFRTRFVTGGFLEADGEIWDDTGRLVAQSRQLALVPRSS
jgi:hypothetical protein